MNEKTKQRLESEINVPAPTQPVDKLRIAESPVRQFTHLCAHALGWCVEVGCLTGVCFADDE